MVIDTRGGMRRLSPEEKMQLQDERKAAADKATSELQKADERHAKFVRGLEQKASAKSKHEGSPADDVYYARQAARRARESAEAAAAEGRRTGKLDDWQDRATAEVTARANPKSREVPKLNLDKAQENYLKNLEATEENKDQGELIDVDGLKQAYEELKDTFEFLQARSRRRRGAREEMFKQQQASVYQERMESEAEAEATAALNKALAERGRGVTTKDSDTYKAEKQSMVEYPDEEPTEEVPMLNQDDIDTEEVARPAKRKSA